MSTQEEFEQRPDWDQYFLTIAAAVAIRADCKRSRHGAVIVKDNRIVSTGYNGSAPGEPSCLGGFCPRGNKSYDEKASLNADYSDCISLHAEQNAIVYADRDKTQGATIYIAGGKDACDMCKKLIKAAGIERTVWM